MKKGKINDRTFDAIQGIRKDHKEYPSYGKTTTKRRVYKECMGKKARKEYYHTFEYLTRNEIDRIVARHVEYLQDAIVLAHVGSILIGDLRRANLVARAAKQAKQAI